MPDKSLIACAFTLHDQVAFVDRELSLVISIMEITITVEVGLRRCAGQVMTLINHHGSAAADATSSVHLRY